MRDETLRLFFGIMLPPAIRGQLQTLQEALSRTPVRVKWVEPHNLHLTLRFLGETPVGAVPDLELTGQRLGAEQPSWELQLRGVGAFPSPRRPQVLWAGVGTGAETLTRFAETLRQALAEQGLVGKDGREKSFSAHCTLGRVRQDRGAGALTALLREQEQFASEVFPADSYQLLASELTENGSIYRVLASFSFHQRRG